MIKSVNSLVLTTKIIFCGKKKRRIKENKGQKTHKEFFKKICMYYEKLMVLSFIFKGVKQPKPTIFGNSGL